MRKGNRIVIIWVSVILLFLFIAVGFMIGSKFCAKESTFFLFQNIISISYVLLGIAVIIPLHERLSLISILIMVGNGILSLGQLYFLTYRTYHRLLIIIFALTIFYMLFCLLRFFISRKSQGGTKKTQLLNGIVPIAYVGGAMLVKGFALFKLIETEIDVPLALVGITLGLSVVAVILGTVFMKDRRNRKEYAGKLCAIFFGVFFVVFGIPLLFIEYANYAFDSSTGEKQECVIIDKETTHNYKSGTGYRLIIRAGDQKLHFDVDKMLYFQYEKGDTICLYAYDGVFDYPYYEYRLDEIYRYEE